jgi:hypothetical protein
MLCCEGCLDSGVPHHYNDYRCVPVVPVSSATFYRLSSSVDGLAQGNGDGVQAEQHRACGVLLSISPGGTAITEATARKINWKDEDVRVHGDSDHVPAALCGPQVSP